MQNPLLKLQEIASRGKQMKDLTITEKFLSLGKKARSGTKFKKPVDGIVVHWIGPYNQVPTSPWNWWENGEDGKGVVASAHFIMKDETVLQALPLDEVGWHSGDERNYHMIGIEVCPADAKTGEFGEVTKQTLKKLIKYIRDKFPTQTLQITRHYDGTQKKDCPRFYTPVVAGGQARWEELVKFIESA